MKDLHMEKSANLEQTDQKSTNLELHVMPIAL
jgi:hypothetical protein